MLQLIAQLRRNKSLFCRPVQSVWTAESDLHFSGTRYIKKGGAEDSADEEVCVSEIVITQDDQRRILDAHQDDVIVFRLEENLTTGYRWELETLEGTIVKLIESIHLDASEMAMGRGGTRVLRFEARSPGSQEIHLKLRRPWDMADKALQQMVVTIRVR